MTRLRVLVLSGLAALALTYFAAVMAFEIVLLDDVSETSSNASIGDLNGDGHQDIVVGYTNAPGVVYYNDRAGRNFAAHSFGDGKEQFMEWPAATSTETDDSTVAARSDAASFILFTRAPK